MALYGTVKRLYKACVPRKVQYVLGSADYPFARMLEPLKRLLRRGAPHDDVYDQSYYEESVSKPALRSAALMARSVVELLRPTSVVDVGCGTGALLAEIQQLGVRCLGLDNATAAIELARRRGLDVQRFDLESNGALELRADLAISLEVAEHLPERCADRYVDLLTSIADELLMTAARPAKAAPTMSTNSPRNTGSPR